jgi:formylglycine-generating enzyme required for sulfatase activity
MSAVVAGEFLMGTDSGEPMSIANEQPRHTVTLKAFCIDTNEATNAEYEACQSASKCTAPKTVDPASNYGDPAYAGRPIVGLNWDQATAYCDSRGKRLPTEAEWEKAARGSAPDSRTYPWGAATPDTMALNFCPQNSDVADGSQDVSPFGVRALVSGAPEWVSDWYDASYYLSSPAHDPRGPANGTDHVVRGGPCASCAAATRSYRISARMTCQDRPIDATGVRCASDAP